MANQQANQEYLLEQITNFVHDCHDLGQIFQQIAIKTRNFLGVDRVKIYKFAKDHSGEVVAESVSDRLPSLAGLHFPATDIPDPARQQFKEFSHGVVIDVSAKRKIITLKNQKQRELIYQPVDECHLQYLLGMGVLSSMSMPILYWDELWGLLVAHHSEPRRFSEQELQTIELLSKQISLTLAQKTLLIQAQQQRKQEEFIERIEQILLTHLDEAEAWQNILEETLNQLNANGGYLHFTPEVTGKPAQIYQAGIKLNFDLETNNQWQEFLKQKCLVKMGYSPSEAYPHLKILPQVYTLTDFANQEFLYQTFSNQALHSFLFIPLRSSSQWIGCLTLFRQQQAWETLWAGKVDYDSRNNLPRQSFDAWCEIQHYAPDWTEENLKFAQALGIHLYMTVTQRRLSHLISQQASYDGLTQLPNPILFNQRLSLALVNSLQKGEMLAVMLLDLDKFKRVNEALGHRVGDYLLREVTERLQTVLDGHNLSDTLLARWHGDGFTILVPQISYTDDAIILCQKLLACLQDSFYVQSQNIPLSASVGIALAPYDGDNSETLLKNAETAMYEAKQQSKNSYQLYNSEMSLNRLHKLSLEVDLCKALERDEFILYYQPQIDLTTGKVIGMEALIRWQHPRLGLVPPDTFISLAEETRLIDDIGEWVLEAACKQQKIWRLAGFPQVQVGVNLSPYQLQNKNLVTSIFKIIQKTQISPKDLVLEITESAVMEDVKAAIEILTELKQQGIMIALDDFGTGYSSLSILKHFPVDILKIDQSFVKDLMNDSCNAGLCQGIITLGKALNLTVLAEGIETEAQWSFLRSANCDLGQGYWFAKPLPSERVINFLLERNISFETQQPDLNIEALLQTNDNSLVGLVDRQMLPELKEEIDQKLYCQIQEYMELKEELQRQATRERLVMKIAQKIRESLKLSDILNATVTEVCHLINADRVFLFRFNEEWQGEVVIESVVSPELSILGEWIDEPCFREQYVKYYRQGRVRAINDITKAGIADCHLKLLQHYQVKSNLVLPIVYQERLWGLMIAHQCREIRHWQQSEITLLSQIATQAAIAIHQGEIYEQLTIANLELEKLSSLDGLTQIPNRHRFDTYLQQEWKRAIRSRENISLILCDVDHFKWYNDTYGHQAGDICLQQVARAISNTVQRPADLAARYGGEEFVVVLPNTPIDGALHLAEMIRSRVKELGITHEKSSHQTVTLSLGVATIIPNPSISSEVLIQNADQALYQAKAQGRDQACVYE
jgi:diguanylate cyclase (GGDEF)-like protein